MWHVSGLKPLFLNKFLFFFLFLSFFFWRNITHSVACLWPATTTICPGEFPLHLHKQTKKQSDFMLEGDEYKEIPLFSTKFNLKMHISFFFVCVCFKISHLLYWPTMLNVISLLYKPDSVSCFMSAELLWSKQLKQLLMFPGLLYSFHCLIFISGM